ncbi:MAG: DUF2169 domain-containing protein, partial [Deltaproteobacteria bacterium]|nr:DUF2169 domain-containing protein [Deltaproteobacteria bacterium]
MKIYKKNEHSVLVTPFGVGGKLYLSVTTMIFFDLTAPESPLKEQELWGVIPGELPKGHVLDQGLPKPKREVLVTGACCAPRGEIWPGAEISFRVGNLRKRLMVFGDRYWRMTGYAVNAVTPATAFSQMPISYENAFGGPGFEFNPLGKGLQPTKFLGVDPLIPLPNIENPQHLMAMPEDRPQPAGFGPLDMMWPQRARKNGTYDDKWLRERWPFFPDDMNYEFFNTAPEDQQAEGFFRGDENLKILHMHPDYQDLTSRLPGLRIRCFVTQKTDLKPTANAEEIFKEVTTRIDTVWLFPGILRGVVMYRGSTKILDDEYSDVTHLFVASENLAEPPKPIEFYHQDQLKATDLKVPIDLSPLADAPGKTNKALHKLRLIPQQLNDAKKRAMGQAPRLGITPEEAMAAGPKIIQDQLSMLTALETKLQALKVRLSPFSHLVKVDYGFIADIRTKLLA